MGHAEWARDLARRLLETPLSRRWAHTQGVAARAASLAPILGDEVDTLTAAAYLHDVGYSPELVDTGFHPLDGARYLRDVAGVDQRLCCLVAHHSCAVNEATERALADVLRVEFTPEREGLTDALTYCDMTTGPDGGHLDVTERLAEIHSRYGPEHLVSRSIGVSTPCILTSVSAVKKALRQIGNAAIQGGETV
ncbi:HDIG domain-containing protein [Microbispora corallina]|uniref:Metal-dependent phosphohydrolase, HD subdomain protein n=1 Tax=Microbispora corallina TaxID=83302 RepID=A0ABQ4G8Y6_9ACTN|nr:HD domain-containing protein [Microbispora corallina]GIH43505.1 metal-dependent phosphohydrolase, HD subdomain protein [Microbispora corallina]